MKLKSACAKCYSVQRRAVRNSQRTSRRAIERQASDFIFVWKFTTPRNIEIPCSSSLKTNVPRRMASNPLLHPWHGHLIARSCPFCALIDSSLSIIKTARSGIRYKRAVSITRSPQKTIYQRARVARTTQSISQSASRMVSYTCLTWASNLRRKQYKLDLSLDHLSHQYAG